MNFEISSINKEKYTAIYFMAGRPRRTRIYGANYNIGESYYKPTLDNIDRKYFGSSRDRNVGHAAERSSFDLNNGISTSVFKKALTEEPTFYKSNGAKTTFTSDAFGDNDFDEDVLNTLKKIRQVKKVNSNFLEEDTIAPTHFKKRAFNLNRSELDDDIENNSAGLSISRFHKTLTLDENPLSSSAALRANATKERLANIDFEMSEQFEKQAQREKRSAHLKQFLNDTDIENTKVVKKVTF